MKIDKIVIQRFLEKMNSISDIVEFFVDSKEERRLVFKTKMRTDLFIEGGIMNYTDDYVLLVRKACKKYFNSDVSFNNTGSIFWIHKNNN